MEPLPRRGLTLLAPIHGRRVRIDKFFDIVRPCLDSWSKAVDMLCFTGDTRVRVSARRVVSTYHVRQQRVS